MLTELLSIFLTVVALLLSVPVAVLAVQVISGTLGRRWPGTPMTNHRPTVALLVPAHNEAACIANACKMLSRHLNASDRLLVVADNCSDTTASLARAAGAEVIERHDTARRGKGYAIDFGMRHLANKPPEALIVVDADCSLTEGSVDYLARSCIATQRPVQATYVMRNHAGASLRMRIAEFAAIVKMFVRPLGYRRLGLPCHLMGTGMGFPWPLVESAELASGHIVEDMKLGVDLARAGSPPLFCPDAEVTSFFPQSEDGIRTQRTRWEHGHLSVILSDSPRIMGAAIRRRNAPLFALALDLAVPPLALLALFIAATTVASAFFATFTGHTIALWASGLTFIIFACVILVAWSRYARAVVSGVELLLAPIYVLSKIPIYLRFLYARQIDWVRSARKGE